MDKLRFGPAGIPRSNPEPGVISAVNQVRNLGLDCMELEFVRDVFLNKKSAEELGKEAKKNDVILTAHASYFVNLNSADRKIIEASKKRIIKAAEMAWLAGGYSVTFHAAYYMKEDPVKVYDKVKQEVKEIVKKLKDEGNKIWIRPETTGKGSQFGNINEIIRMSKELDQVMPCIDFSHLFARSTGKINTAGEFRKILEAVEKELGKKGLHEMHIHVSGIQYSPKGERNHVDLDECDLNYQDLVKVWKEFKIKGCVISESPNLERDALILKKVFGS